MVRPSWLKQTVYQFPYFRIYMGPRNFYSHSSTVQTFSEKMRTLLVDQFLLHSQNALRFFLFLFLFLCLCCYAKSSHSLKSRFLRHAIGLFLASSGPGLLLRSIAFCYEIFFYQFCNFIFYYHKEWEGTYVKQNYGKQRHMASVVQYASELMKILIESLTKQ